MSPLYQTVTGISLEDVHYAPLAPGERDLGLIGDVDGKKILELACGAAQNSIALAKWGADVIAVDFSSVQLAKARELVKNERVNVNLVKCDMEKLDIFRTGSFDVVISSFGWEYVTQFAECVKECFRVLKGGGRVVASTVHPLTAFEWDDLQKSLLVEDYFRPQVELWQESTEIGVGQGVTIFRTLEEIFETFSSAGFIVRKVLEPMPYNIHQLSEAEKNLIPYRGKEWDAIYERLSKIPFAVVIVADSPQ